MRKAGDQSKYDQKFSQNLRISDFLTRIFKSLLVSFWSYCENVRNRADQANSYWFWAKLPKKIDLWLKAAGMIQSSYIEILQTFFFSFRNKNPEKWRASNMKWSQKSIKLMLKLKLQVEANLCILAYTLIN